MIASTFFLRVIFYYKHSHFLQEHFLWIHCLTSNHYPFFDILPSPSDLLLRLCSYRGCTTAGKLTSSFPPLTTSFPACLHPITAHFRAPGITRALTHFFLFLYLSSLYFRLCIEQFVSQLGHSISSLQ